MNTFNFLFPIILLTFGVGLHIGGRPVPNMEIEMLKLNEILTLTNALALVAFAAVINSFLSEYFEKKQLLKLKKRITLFLGVCVLIITIVENCQPNPLVQSNTAIQTKLDTANAYLRHLDSLGIHWDSVNNRPVISKSFVKNIKYLIHIDTVKTLPPPPKVVVYTPSSTNSQVPDSENYIYSLSVTKDSLVFVPKEGVWVKPFFSYDTSDEKNSGEIQQPDGYGSMKPSVLSINGKRYVVNSVMTVETRSKNRPFAAGFTNYAMLSKIKYLIFGDESVPSKRYMYKNGKVFWIPNNE